MSAPRGIRNNNPGNLEPVARWRGLVGSDGRFAKFDTPRNGLRAIGVDLRAKMRRGLKTPRAVIEEYAPPNENNTEMYIKAVTSFVGIGDTQPIPIHDAAFLELWLKAITKHENGNGPPGNPFWYDDKTFKEAALDVARPLPVTRTAAGTATAAAGAAGTAATVAVQTIPAPIQLPPADAVMESMSGAMEKLPEVVGQASDVATTTATFLPKWAPFVFIGVILIGIAVVWYARVKDRNDGLR